MPHRQWREGRSALPVSIACFGGSPGSLRWARSSGSSFSRIHPKTEIGRGPGIAIPDSMTVEVHESDMQTVHPGLPPDPNLTGEQLEAVSPGLCCR